MNNFHKIISKLRFFNFLLPIYLLGGIVVIPLLEHQICDTTSYVTIAQKYFNGDFSNALNGCWSPLISWLLALFLFIPKEPILLLKMLNFIIGGIIFFQIDQLFKRFQIQKPLYLLGMLVGLPTIWFYAPLYGGADILAAFFYIWIYNLTANYHFENIYRTILICLVACLGYLSKAYFLPFFISYITLLFFIENVNHQLKKILPQFIFILVGFISCVVIWNMLLVPKYGYFSMSYSGDYNIHLIQSGGKQVIYDFCLLEPPNETAFSYWEDPLLYKDYTTTWNPFSSMGNFTAQLKLILSNIGEFLNILNRNNPFWIVSIIGLCLIVLKEEKFKIVIRQELTRMIVFLMLTVAGYFLLFFHDRYLYTWFFMLIFIQTFIIDNILKTNILNQGQQYLLGGFVFLLLIIIPLEKILKYKNFNQEAWQYHQEIEALDIRLDDESNVALMNLNRLHYLTIYYQRWKYYGFLENCMKETTEESIEAKLKTKGVNYLIIDKNKKGYSFLEKYNDITEGKVSGFRMYHLKKE